MVLYDVDASLPACFQITGGLCQMDSNMVLNWHNRHILSPPPGCLGANSVMSQTLPSTTIQQSSGVLCLEISSTEIRFPPAILAHIIKAIDGQGSHFGRLIAFEPAFRKHYPNLRDQCRRDIVPETLLGGDWVIKHRGRAFPQDLSGCVLEELTVISGAKDEA